MPEIARLDRNGAKHDPRQFFASPYDIVGEQMLTRGEKLATLERWRAMILQEMAAASEGMRTYGLTGVGTGELDEIEKARTRLHVFDDR
jgi:hypothetical protein